jgi:hypothetical protein
VALALFVFIAWVIISVYLFVPKRLSTEENILLFLVFTIIIINIFTILDFDLKLIQHSLKKDKFIGFWIHRNIIIPLTLIIFVNFIDTFKNKMKKVITTMLTFLVLYIIDLLAFGIGFMTCSSNLYLGSAFILMVLMLLAFLTMELITKLPKRKSM